MNEISDKRISIIVPTYKRPDKLKRALLYYSRFDLPVFVADGSPEPYSATLEGNVRYFHIPSVLICERIYRVLCEVKTEYACFSADDDFVRPPFLEKAAALLDSEASISTVFGRCYTFQERDPRDWNFREPYAKAIEDGNPTERLRSFFSMYFSLFYTPARTRVMREIFREMAHFPTHYMNIVETMHDARIVIEGTVAYLDEFSNAREGAKEFTAERLEMTGPHDILRKDPLLENELDDILKKWLPQWKYGMFRSLILDSWTQWDTRRFKPWIRLVVKIKLAVSSLLGAPLKKRIKKRLPFLAATPDFDMSTCKDREALLEIQRLVLSTAD